ncbi:Alpha/Beta hydrolase protein [Aspergillus ambiguus]|uniref:Alpha/Beta hydrolase protein n=1 Tax=Aspergillus ambiguus TaxID=176160 RepID=UPI003CCE200D
MGAAMDCADDASVSKLDPPFLSASSLLSRRRKSIPSRSHSANPSTVDPGSPEVISSLISSLSTISVPLQTHFDNVPRIDSETDPSSPVFLPPEQHSVFDQRPPSSGHGFGVTYGAPPAPEDPPHSPFLHPDDAAVAPVIRMARAPPSPKAKSTFDPPSSPARPTSRGSYTSSKAAYEDYAFGMITAEPGPRASTAASITSTSSRKSLKNQLGLMKKSSREFLGDKDRQAERLRKTSSYNDGLRHNIPRNRASLRSLYSMADVAEEGRPSAASLESSGGKVVSTPPSKERYSQQSTRESAPSTPGGIGSGRMIPARESSLRHSFSSSPRQRRSSRHSRHPSTGSRDAKVDSGIAGVENEAEQVAKRIQELKDQQQKIKNELETDDSPDRSSREAPARPARRSQRIDEDNSSRDAATSSGFDESAPAPAVMTGKNRLISRNNSPLASKSTNMPASPFLQRQSFDKPEIEKLRYRQSSESATPPRHHKRSPSGPVSPNGASVAEERPSSADSVDLAVIDYISSPKLTQRVYHPTTGRVIAFSEVGDPKGHVVLCCLGMGLTRYLMAFYDELARSLRLRLITLDRPGVGESGPYVDESGTPLSWPDDVAIVCNHLRVTKFSILGHSAGAIYALATALRIPQHIRGRLHLLAPWIPPSQLCSLGSQKAPVPTNAVPYSQRILRALPTSILKVANSSFMSATSASLTTSLPKSPRRAKRRATVKEIAGSDANGAQKAQAKMLPQTADLKTETVKTASGSAANGSKSPQVATTQAEVDASEEQERQTDYDNRLTHKIWECATTNANPAVDLLVCLERHQPIGFRYVDITRNVVIHHGSRDTRVPVDNVRWLGQTMRRCEVRVLEGEGHGLMASATVMGNVLMEIAKEWEDWMIVVQGRRRGTIGPRTGIPIQA